MSQAPTDKLYDHHRQQLSAMLDGELAPDQAKFMLRRLEHDAELAACWERWQVCGDVLRGCHEALLPRDFSQRVADAISDRHAVPGEAAAAAPGKSHWVRWSGGAVLAATVAMAAVLVARQLPEADDGATAVPAQVAANTASGPAAVSTGPGSRSAPDAAESGKPLAPPAAAALATAVATADVPRRAAERRSRAQAQRAATRIRRQADDAPALVAVNAPVATAAAPASATTRLVEAPALAGTDPFVPRAPAHGRPWPRAIVPALSSDNAFTASFGGSVAPAPFHPFEPRVELQPAQSADGRLDADSGPR